MSYGRCKCFFTSLLLMLLLAPGAMAQNEGGIRGVVRDKEFDVPLSNASVWITETGARTETGPEGLFVFHELAPGTYTVIIGKEGSPQGPWRISPLPFPANMWIWRNWL
jgi:hypothetical protein